MIVAPRPRWLPIAALVGFAAAFAGLVWAVLPAGVVVMNDDFGYLRSVIETLQRGRPWTNDWLEPWNAGLSILSALVWRVTGSFLIATQGVQAALAGLALALLIWLLRMRGLGWSGCVVTSIVALTMPTMFGKVMEYTGVALALPCLLLAIAAAEKGHWRLFLCVWIVALATRQSAAAWGALPLIAAWEHWRGSKRGALAAVAVWAGGVAAYFLLLTLMNRTHAQGAVTAHMWENLRAVRAAELAGIGGLVFFGAAGLATWFSRTRWRVAPWWQWIAMAIAVGWLGWGLEWHDRVYFEHSRYRDAGQLYLRGLLIVAALGWLTHAVRLRWSLCAGGVAALALVCLRRDVWDYYFIDVFVFGFLAIKSDPAASSPEPRWESVRTTAVCSAAIVLVWCHARFAAEFKAEADSRWAAIALAEQALRDGKMQVSEIVALPFGYIGWTLFPDSLRRRPDGGTEGDNFFDYLSEFGVEVKQVAGDGWARKWMPGEDPRPRELVARGAFRVCWRQADFELVRFTARSGAPAKRALPANFVRPVFPLNDAEWAALIRAER